MERSPLSPLSHNSPARPGTRIRQSDWRANRRRNPVATITPTPALAEEPCAQKAGNSPKYACPSRVFSASTSGVECVSVTTTASWSRRRRRIWAPFS
eukprot:8392313-Pyramimonas_sp.AAC.1